MNNQTVKQGGKKEALSKYLNWATSYDRVQSIQHQLSKLKEMHEKVASLSDSLCGELLHSDFSLSEHASESPHLDQTLRRQVQGKALRATGGLAGSSDLIKTLPLQEPPKKPENIQFQIEQQLKIESQTKELLQKFQHGNQTKSAEGGSRESSHRKDSDLKHLRDQYLAQLIKANQSREPSLVSDGIQGTFIEPFNLSSCPMQEMDCPIQHEAPTVKPFELEALSTMQNPMQNDQMAATDQFNRTQELTQPMVPDQSPSNSQQDPIPQPGPKFTLIAGSQLIQRHTKPIVQATSREPKLTEVDSEDLPVIHEEDEATQHTQTPVLAAKQGSCPQANPSFSISGKENRAPGSHCPNNPSRTKEELRRENEQLKDQIQFLYSAFLKINNDPSFLREAESVGLGGEQPSQAAPTAPTSKNEPPQSHDRHQAQHQAQHQVQQQPSNPASTKQQRKKKASEDEYMTFNKGTGSSQYGSQNVDSQHSLGKRLPPLPQPGDDSTSNGSTMGMYDTQKIQSFENELAKMKQDLDDIKLTERNFLTYLNSSQGQGSSHKGEHPPKPEESKKEDSYQSLELDKLTRAGTPREGQPAVAVDFKPGSISGRQFLNEGTSCRDYVYPFNFGHGGEPDSHLVSVAPAESSCSRPTATKTSTEQNQKARQFIKREVIGSDVLESTKSPQLEKLGKVGNTVKEFSLGSMGGQSSSIENFKIFDLTQSEIEGASNKEGSKTHRRRPQHLLIADEDTSSEIYERPLDDSVVEILNNPKEETTGGETSEEVEEPQPKTKVPEASLAAQRMMMRPQAPIKIPPRTLPQISHHQQQQAQMPPLLTSQRTSQMGTSHSSSLLKPQVLSQDKPSELGQVIKQFGIARNQPQFKFIQKPSVNSTKNLDNRKRLNEFLQKQQQPTYADANKENDGRDNSHIRYAYQIHQQTLNYQNYKRSNNNVQVLSSTAGRVPSTGPKTINSFRPTLALGMSNSTRSLVTKNCCTDRKASTGNLSARNSGAPRPSQLQSAQAPHHGHAQEQIYPTSILFKHSSSSKKLNYSLKDYSQQKPTSNFEYDRLNSSRFDDSLLGDSKEAIKQRLFEKNRLSHNTSVNGCLNSSRSSLNQRVNSEREKSPLTQRISSANQRRMELEVEKQRTREQKLQIKINKINTLQVSRKGTPRGAGVL